jgi:hypothetical protein
MSEWISVEDRLPEQGEHVLLFNGHWTGVGKHQPDPDYPDEGGCPYPWQDERTEWIEPFPTHWMPLPAPPERA